MTTFLPFSTSLDFRSGSLEPHDDVLVRRLSDMAGAYADDEAASRLLQEGDPVIYRAFTAAVPEEPDQLIYRTTIIQPGRVGREYFMTNGHHHERDSAELYLGMAGSGLMVLQNRDRQHHLAELVAHRAVYVPPGWAHRTVNTGEEELVFLAVYFGDAGHDYSSMERDGFAVRVVRGSHGPDVVAA